MRYLHSVFGFSFIFSSLARKDIRDPRIAGTFIKSGILFIIKNCNSWMKQPVVTGSFPTDLKAELTKELAAGQNKLGCNLLFLVATIAGVMHCMIIDLLFLFSAWIPLVKNSTNALVPEYLVNNVGTYEHPEYFQRFQ